MADSQANKVGSWDAILKNASIILGLISTGIGIFVAVTTLATNRQLDEIKRATAAAESRTKKIESERVATDLQVANFDRAARIEIELGASNANEFATNYLDRTLKFEIPDPKMQEQLAYHAPRWKTRNGLMTGKATDGLFLRQVVWLRLTNLGKGPARDIRVLVRQKDFDNLAGTDAENYVDLDTGKAGWVDGQLPLSSLMESGTRDMRTQVRIPLAHVSGGRRFYGRIFIPVKVVWKDERLGKDGSLDIHIASESLLRTTLGSAILGKSETAAKASAANAP